MNKVLDFSVIEIKEDKNNKIYFLEIDENIYNKEYELYYYKKTMYILCYNDENKISVSYGVINHINKDEIIYSGYSNLINLCWPIFDLSNNKLLGIYNKNSKIYNKGIFFKFIINEFINKYKYIIEYKSEKKVENEFNILINITKKSVNKINFFLDNYFYKDNKGMNHFNDNLKELNEFNTDLYINNHKYKYQKYFIPEKEGKYNIKLKFSINLTDCSYMFAGCENIINIDFIHFNTKYVTNMKYMFYENKNLENINLFSFDAQNVTNISYMFYNCICLNNLDLYSLNTKKVIDMNNMFSQCDNLNNLCLSSFNTDNVENMSDMFSFCVNLIKLDLSSFSTNSVSNMSYMFYYCKNLKYLNLSLPKTKTSVNKNYMLESCPNLNLASFSNNSEECINKYENEIDIVIFI